MWYTFKYLQTHSKFVYCNSYICSTLLGHGLPNSIIHNEHRGFFSVAILKLIIKLAIATLNQTCEISLKEFFLTFRIVKPEIYLFVSLNEEHRFLPCKWQRKKCQTFIKAHHSLPWFIDFSIFRNARGVTVAYRNTSPHIRNRRRHIIPLSDVLIGNSFII